MVTRDVRDIPQGPPRECNPVLLSAKARFLVEFWAVIATAWLVDAHVLVLCLCTAVYMRSGLKLNF